jgi:hypothetical protein
MADRHASVVCGTFGRVRINEITDIERLYTEGKEEPTLGRAYTALLLGFFLVSSTGSAVS